MKVVLVSQYFWPESFIINDFVKALSDQGHEVLVATGKPNYPDGEVFEGYRALGVHCEKYQNCVDVVRIPIWPRGKGGAKNLILNYLSFVFAGTLLLPWLLRKRKVDAVFVFAPSPITQAIPAIALKCVKKAPLALWIQDLWPESLQATGFVRHPFLLKMTGWIVKAIYRGCDLLLVQSRAFVDDVAMYAARDKIIYYPNSMRVQNSTEQAVIPEELCELLEQHFCLVFAGNLGTAQGLEILVKAAEALRDVPQIRIVLVGSGSRLNWLHEQKSVLGLDNLVLPGRFPMSAMPAIFERAAGLLVSLADEPIFARTVPSKVQAYLAAGRPILASLSGEGARVIEEAGAGLCSSAGQIDPFVENILRLCSMTDGERQSMGNAGKQFFIKNFDMDEQVKVLTAMLQSIGKF